MITEGLILFMNFLHFGSNIITLELSRYKYLSPLLLMNGDINSCLRIVFFNYFHQNNVHLILNMLIFYKIGKMIEVKLKPLNYFSLVFNISILVGILILIIRILLFIITKERYYFTHNIIGFSAVLYSLTYICLYNIHYNHIIVIQHIFYEFVINYLLFPESSLIAHFSGILIGMLIIIIKRV
jgi:membrane associated rhomboid family serine protease